MYDDLRSHRGLETSDYGVDFVEHMPSHELQSFVTDPGGGGDYVTDFRCARSLLGNPSISLEIKHY